MLFSVIRLVSELPCSAIRRADAGLVTTQCTVVSLSGWHAIFRRCSYVHRFHYRQKPAFGLDLWFTAGAQKLGFKHDTCIAFKDKGSVF